MAFKRMAWVVAGLLTAGGLVALVAATAGAQEGEAKASIKGRVAGGQQLLNPVWNEAKDPKKHRYTFRMPSTTVGSRAKTLSAYLPKEVAVVALAESDVTPSGTYTVHVSGGRTTPVTVVVPSGGNVQFVNDDPFAHKLFSVNKDKGSLGPEETKKQEQRTWQPPGAGVYEIRDAYFPSIRTWVVVEPKAAGVGYPNLKNEFVIANLPAGVYKIQAYFSGKPVGKALDFELRGTPELQQLTAPVVLAEKKKKKTDDDDKKEEKE